MITDIKRIRLKNFFGIKDQEIPISDQGLVLITGENGSCKTAMFIEGVYYGLYGKSIEYGENPGKKIQNRWAKSVLVEIDFETSGQLYRVIRSRGSKDIENGLSLYILRKDTTEDITLGNSALTQTFINKLIGLGPKAFLSSVMFTTDILRFPSFSDGEKKKVFDDLLGLEVVDHAHKETKEKHLKKAKAKVTELEVELVLKLDHQKGSDERHTNELKRFNSWTPELANEEIDEEIRETEEEIEEEKKELKNLVLVEYDQGGHESCKSKKDTLLNERNELSDGITNVIAKLATIKAKRDGITSRMSKRADLIKAGKCLTCEQKVEGDIYLDEITDLKKQNLDLSAKKEKYQKLLEEAKEEKERLSIKIDKANASIRGYEMSKKDLEHQGDVINSLKTSIKRSKSRIERLEESKVSDTDNPHAESLKESKDGYDKVCKDVKSIKIKLKKARSKLEDEQALEKGFGPKGFRLNTLQDAIPFLNKEARVVCGIMETQIQVAFSLRTKDESYSGQLSVDVENPKGSGTYVGNSAGEKRRVDLIVLFCLLKLSMKGRGGTFKQLFFDEALEKLDENGEFAFVKVMKYLAEDKNSVFMINHKAFRASNEVDQVWSVSNGELTIPVYDVIL